MTAVNIFENSKIAKIWVEKLTGRIFTVVRAIMPLLA